MQSGKIPDSRLTSSSEWSSSWGPRYSRLHGNKCWIARSRDVNQWLQIDFKYKATVTDILTQGRRDANQWVTSYTVAYSNDGRNFKTYKGEKGQDKVNHSLEQENSKFFPMKYCILVRLTFLNLHAYLITGIFSQC